MNPFKSQQMAAPRNMLSGYAEPAHVNDFMFEQQRRTFSTYGKLVCDLWAGCKWCGQCIEPVWILITFFTSTLSPPLIGYALDPSVDTHQVSSTSYIGALDEAEKNKGEHSSRLIPNAFVCIRLCTSDFI